MANLIFNDIDFSDLIRVLDVKRSVLPVKQDYTLEVPVRHGMYYTGYKYGERSIDVDFALITKDTTEYFSQLRILADALNVDEPCKLIVGDELDKYYYAVPSSDSAIDQVVNIGKGTITFICYDPVAYSDETVSFTGDNTTGKTQIENNGTLDVPPVISVGFTKDAHFLQVTNFDRKTILLGTPPNVDNQNVTPSPVVLKDDCTTTANWIDSGNVLDSHDVQREVMGTATVNRYGTGITGNDYGQSDRGWHGCAKRRNLPMPIQDFDVNLEIAFDSKDTGVSGSGGTGNTATSGEYTITGEPNLRIRQERNTTSKILGNIPKGKVVTVTDIQNGWGKVTYNNVTGFISMSHTKVYVPPTTSHRTTANLNMRKGRGTNYGILCTIPKGTAINVTDIQKGWGKCTYNNKTGYVSTQYLTTTYRKAKSIKDVATVNIDARNFADFSKMGRIEIYLFDDRNQKIGKFSVRDCNEFYEFAQPEIYIGNEIVLKDEYNVPKPKTKTEKDKEGNTITTNIDSGKYGTWNDGTICMSMKRQNNPKTNKAEWRAWFGLKRDGKMVAQKMTNMLVNNKYPTGDLSSIVVWFGQYKDAPLVDTISLEDIEVIQLNTPQNTAVNEPVFKNGDEVVIDNDSNMVYLNGLPCLDILDIGSQYFTSKTGISEFIVISDDKDIDVDTTIRERYI